MYASLEWIVIVFAIVAIIKIIFVFGNRNAWISFLDRLYSRPTLCSLTFLILAGIIFYYLIQTMTIVEILAAGAFTACLMAMAFVHFGREIKSLVKKMIATPLTGMIWIYILIWIALLAWALWEIFA